MSKGQSLQEPFLNALRRERVPVSIYLVNGIKLQGQIESFDQFVVADLQFQFFDIERRLDHGLDPIVVEARVGAHRSRYAERRSNVAEAGQGRAPSLLSLTEPTGFCEQVERCGAHTVELSVRPDGAGEALVSGGVLDAFDEDGIFVIYLQRAASWPEWLPRRYYQNGRRSPRPFQADS